jgi:hypothetical protein
VAGESGHRRHGGPTRLARGSSRWRPDPNGGVERPVRRDDGLWWQRTVEDGSGGRRQQFLTGRVSGSDGLE